MRGKLRDKRDVKRDRLKRETLMGRRPSKRENRNLHLQQYENDENEYLLDEEEETKTAEEKQN
jgi:hypothetical protein